MKSVRATPEMVNQCRRLPVLLETFLGACFRYNTCSERTAEDTRERYILINRQVTTYMALHRNNSGAVVRSSSLSSEDHKGSARHIKPCFSTGRMVHGLGTSPTVRASSTILPNPSISPLISRLEETIFSAYTLHFQTSLFSILPPSFLLWFKAHPKHRGEPCGR